MNIIKWIILFNFDWFTTLTWLAPKRDWLHWLDFLDWCMVRLVRLAGLRFSAIMFYSYWHWFWLFKCLSNCLKWTGIKYQIENTKVCCKIWGFCRWHQYFIFPILRLYNNYIKLVAVSYLDMLLHLNYM